MHLLLNQSFRCRDFNHSASFAAKTNWSAVAKRATAKPFGVDVAQLKAKQEAAAREKEAAKQKVDTFLKFSFQIDSINIKMFTGM